MEHSNIDHKTSGSLTALWCKYTCKSLLLLSYSAVLSVVLLLSSTHLDAVSRKKVVILMLSYVFINQVLIIKNLIISLSFY